MAKALRILRLIALAVTTFAVLGDGAPPAVAATSQVLVVTVLGSGQVASKPAGIACPGKCKATFPVGTKVKLVPHPRRGATFLAWGGSCTGHAACTVKMTSLAAVAAQFSTVHAPPAAKSVAAAGYYSGGAADSTESGIQFWVAPGGRDMLNVTIPASGLTCAPSGGFDWHLGMLRVPIKPNGSFAAKASERGIATSGAKVRITYAISGRFQAATANAPASAAGTWREDWTLASGPMTSCTSNAESWSATLHREPAQSKPLVQPGSYKGAAADSTESGISFSVPAGSRSMANVTIPSTGMFCAPSGGIDSQFSISRVPIKRNGSFNATVKQTGILSGAKATFTYTLSGSFEGPTPPSNAPTVAGTWREDITFASGTVKACSSDNQIWSATHS